MEGSDTFFIWQNKTLLFPGFGAETSQTTGSPGMGRLKTVFILRRSGMTFAVTPPITGSVRRPSANMWPETCQIWGVTTASSGPSPPDVCEPLNPAYSLGLFIWPFVFPARTFHLTPEKCLSHITWWDQGFLKAKGLLCFCIPISNQHGPVRQQVPNKYWPSARKFSACLCDSHHTLLSLNWFSFLNVPSVLKQTYLC